MNYRKLIISTIFLFLITGCSFTKKIIYRPHINQGNYFIPNRISKIHIGMKQKQVINTLGSPIMKDLFNNNIWFYIFYHQSNSVCKIIQQNLILTFNCDGILTDIDNQSILLKK